MSGFKKDLGGAEKQTQTLGEKIKGALSPKNLLLAGGGLLAGAQVVGFLKDAVSAASDLGETTSKVNVVFGESADAVLEMGKTSATALGMSENAALAAAGTYGNLFRAMGISTQKSAEMSTELVSLAADLASFNNMDPTVVLDKLRAGLSGETEPLKSLGINLNQARIQAKAMELGLADTTGTLSAAAKAQATYALVLEDTSLAQGDFARTSDGLANQQRIMAAQMENLSAEVGQELLPYMVQFFTFLNDVGVPALRGVFGGIQKVAEGVGWLADVFVGARAEIATFASTFGEMGEKVEATAKLAGVSADEMRHMVEARMNETGESWEAAFERIKDETTSSMVQVNNAVAKNMGGVKQTIVTRSDEIREEWEKTARFLPQAIRDRWDEIRQAGADSVAAYNKGIFDAQNSLHNEIEALLKRLDEGLAPGEEISYLRGKKMELMLARGIAEAKGDRGAVAAVNAMIAEINGRLNTLNGWTAGRNLVITLANGIRENLGTISAASYALATKVRTPVMIESEPKDPNSPLRGITKWGGNIVDTIAEGIYGQLGTGRAAANALAGALVPSVAAPAFAGAGVPGIAGETRIYQLYVDGKEKEVGAATDVLNAWQQMEGF